MEYSLEDLEKDARQKREALNKRIRDNYNLAKDLGFTPAEASVLSMKSETIIRQLAEARHAGLKNG